MLYPPKLSFRIKGWVQSFPGKKKLKEFIITKPLLYVMLKGLKKKNKIKTMNQKRAINTYLSTTESKKQTKQPRNRDRIMDMESILTVARWE